MKFSSTTISILISGLLSGLAIADCNCSHNNDAGRWIDSHSPAAEVINLVNANGGCYTATVQGHMCVTISGSGDDANNVRGCLQEVSADWQSYHGDWFLWTAITCQAGGSVGTVAIN
ncbi:hypothetical protein MFRU_020g00300 [Monilinia fructicola]|nr:hypothetical protein MFRU_020g00300 [Monilinia fructicola]